MTPTVTVDPEFHALIPPLSADERALLEASILAEGCRDALVVWNGVLIDGHNRLDICQRHDLPYSVIEREFDSREDVIVWICTNQMARRNITQFSRDELALKMKKALSPKGKENMAQGLSQNDKPQNTQEDIADLAGTSTGGIAQSEIILNQAPGTVLEQARNGEISRSRAYELTRRLAQLPAGYRDDAARLCGDSTDKADTLVRLHKSAGSPESNGTYDEIMSTGGFHFGDDMEDWCNFHERAMREIDTALKSVADWHKKLARDARKTEREQAFEKAAAISGVRIERVDIRSGLPLDANSVDLILTDPPYPEEYLPLYECLAHEAARVLKPGGSLAVMCGQSYLPEIFRLMQGALTYQWTFAYLTPGGQSAQLWARKVNTFWKPVLWFVKGAYTGEWKGDVTKSAANDKRFDKWGQSESGMADLVERFSQPSDLILDPFVGGGTTGVAAVVLKRQFIGFDLDADKVSISQERIAECVIATA